MIAKKYIEKAAAGLMILAVTLCFAAAACAEQVTAVFGGTGVKMEYETSLFDREEILSIDIRIEDEAWESLLLHAADEEYISCDVIVNGETFYNVGIRPKGNTSLSAIAADPETDRYSFKVEFDHYVEGQSCYGLDKLILNNQSIIPMLFVTGAKESTVGIVGGGLCTFECVCMLIPIFFVERALRQHFDRNGKRRSA